MPGKEWEHIKKILIEVFETGDGPYPVFGKKNLFEYSKIIEGHDVRARYKLNEIENIIFFSGGWIK